MLTSNRTRDVHDALKRRCLYHWVEHPTSTRGRDRPAARCRRSASRWPAQVAAAVEAMRELNLYKPPGVAETIDWAAALGRLGVTRARRAGRRDTLGAVLKYREDHERVEQHGIADVVKRAFERRSRALT